MSLSTKTGPSLQSLVLGLASVYLVLMLLPIASVFVPATLFFLVAFSLAGLLIADAMVWRLGRDLVLYCGPITLLIVIERMSSGAATSAGPLITALYSTLLIMLPAMLGPYLMRPGRERLAVRTLIVATTLLMVTVVTSVIVLVGDPLAARTVTGIADPGDALLAQYASRNLGGFAAVYTAVLTVPLWIALFKRSRAAFSPAIAAIGLIGWYIVLSEFATALLIFICALGSVLFSYHSKLRRLAVPLMVSGIAAIVASRARIAEWLSSLADALGGSMAAERLRAVSDALIGGGGGESFTGRSETYSQSLGTFWSNPVTGATFSALPLDIGGHSFVLDTAARYGIFGLLSIALLYRYAYKYGVSIFRGTAVYAFALISWLLGLLLAIVNPTASLLSLCLLTPLAGHVLNIGRASPPLAASKLESVP